MRLDVTAAVLLETAAFLLVCTSRAAWTDMAALWMVTFSVLCWTCYGARRLNHRGRRHL